MGYWRTVRGRKVYFEDGDDIETALKRSKEYSKKKKKADEDDTSTPRDAAAYYLKKGEFHKFDQYIQEGGLEDEREEFLATAGYGIKKDYEEYKAKEDFKKKATTKVNTEQDLQNQINAWNKYKAAGGNEEKLAKEVEKSKPKEPKYTEEELKAKIRQHEETKAKTYEKDGKKYNIQDDIKAYDNEISRINGELKKLDNGEGRYANMPEDAKKIIRNNAQREIRENEIYKEYAKNGYKENGKTISTEDMMKKAKERSLNDKSYQANELKEGTPYSIDYGHGIEKTAIYLGKDDKGNNMFYDGEGVNGKFGFSDRYINEKVKVSANKDDDKFMELHNQIKRQGETKNSSLQKSISSLNKIDDLANEATNYTGAYSLEKLQKMGRQMGRQDFEKFVGDLKASKNKSLSEINSEFNRAESNWANAKTSSEKAKWSQEADRLSGLREKAYDREEARIKSNTAKKTNGWRYSRGIDGYTKKNGDGTSSEIWYDSKRGKETFTREDYDAQGKKTGSQVFRTLYEAKEGNEIPRTKLKGITSSIEAEKQVKLAYKKYLREHPNSKLKYQDFKRFAK